MLVEELWRPRDEAAQAQLMGAARSGDLAAALLAIEGADADRQREARLMLAALGARARRELASNEPGAAGQAGALRRALEGFEGDRDDYYAPHNSHLSRVLLRRRGLPILLSSVWMLVGDEAGLQVQGVGLPGHFIARVGGDEGQLVDPFSGGTPLSQAACRRLLERAGRGADAEDYFRAVTLRELLSRALRNLLGAHETRREPAEVYRAARLWAALSPGQREPQEVVERVEEALSLRRPRSQAN